MVDLAKRVTGKSFLTREIMFSINPNRNEQDNTKIIYDPIETINTYNQLWIEDPELLKVLTISTNNDIGRNLDSDSFVILHFNKDKSNILDNIEIES